MGLSAQHLTYCHPSILVVLPKLFRLIMVYTHVPAGFHYSYIVPVPKLIDCRTKSVNCDDFRGIAISPILSKVFEQKNEQCILDRFGSSFVSCDAQFGFKRVLVVEMQYILLEKLSNDSLKGNSTVYICLLDLSKAI